MEIGLTSRSIEEECKMIEKTETRQKLNVKKRS